MVIVPGKNLDNKGGLPRILMQPGWESSGPHHWQTLWERRLGCRASRVEHRDWSRPDKAEWLATLKASVLAAEAPVVIIAHSLGCIATAMLLADPAMDRDRVAAAVLVAPADTERPEENPALSGFVPVPTGSLSLPVLVIASTNDPYCTVERAQSFAAAWSADLHIVPGAGHINTESGFGPWQDGWQLVETWLARRQRMESVRSHEEEWAIE